MFLNNNREEIMENKKEPEVTLEDLKDTTSKMFEIYEELLRDHGEIGDGVTFDVNPTGGIIDAFCYGTRPTGEIAEISLVPIEDCDGECRSIYGGNA